MSWSELRILKDDMEREKLRKQTSESILLDDEPELKEKQSSVTRKHRRSLLGEFTKDLDYLESLLTSVKIFDYDIYDPQSSSRTRRNRKVVAIGTSASNSGSENKRKKSRNYGIGVKQEARDALLFLKKRQDFWSQLKPRYCNNP